MMDRSYPPEDHEYQIGGPDPGDRFDWLPAAFIAVAVICIAIAWRLL